MTATLSDLQRWLYAGAEKGYSHMIVLHDSFYDYDYPFYVSQDEDIYKIVAERSNPNLVERIIEIYLYALPFEDQLNERRAWNL